MDKCSVSSPPRPTDEDLEESKAPAWIGCLVDLVHKNHRSSTTPIACRSTKLAELGHRVYGLCGSRYVGCRYPRRSKTWRAKATKHLKQSDVVRKAMNNIGLDVQTSSDDFFIALEEFMRMRRLDGDDQIILFELFDPFEASLNGIPFDIEDEDIRLVGTDLISALVSRSSDESVPEGAVRMRFPTQEGKSNYPPFERLSELEGRRTWVWLHEYDFGAEVGSDVVAVVLETVANDATDWPSVDEQARNGAIASLSSNATCASKLRKNSFLVPGDNASGWASDEQPAAAAYRFFIYLAHEACTDRDVVHKLIEWGKCEYIESLKSANALGLSNAGLTPLSAPVYRTPPNLPVSAAAASTPLTDEVSETPKNDKNKLEAPVASPSVFRALQERFTSLSPRWSRFKTGMTHLFSPRSRSLGNSPSNTTSIGATTGQQVVPGVFSGQQPPLGQGLGLKDVDLGSPLFPSSSRTHLPTELPEGPNAQNSHSPRAPTQESPTRNKGIIGFLRLVSPLFKTKRKRETSNNPGQSSTERPLVKQPKVTEQLEPSSQERIRPKAEDFL